MSATPERSLLIVGDPGAGHVGRHLLEAARELGRRVALLDVGDAFDGPAWRRRLAWRALGHRPPALRSFSRRVAETVRESGATIVLATGLAPVTRETLCALGRLGVRRANFLTDDPWNPAHRAPWFMRALPAYDVVFTPRQANVADLESLGGPRVHLVPFGYDPGVHRPADEPPPDGSAFRCDLMFAGGADADRLRMLTAFVEAGLDVALYGGYWDRHAGTRAHARGFLEPDGLRQAVAGARLCLGLVRRANRDDHSMRTFEVPAMGGCCLIERTPFHEALFGDDGEAVAYFDDVRGAVARARDLLTRPDDRARMAARARTIIVSGRHTYRDRLEAMLGVLEGGA